MLMYFAFRWKHRDGAMVEFEPDGVGPTKVRKVPQDSCQQPGRKAFSPKGEVECTGNTGMKAKRIAKRGNFVSRNEKAKSAVVAQLVRIARKARLGYDDLLYISQQARENVGLRRGCKERRLPQLLADADLKRFFRAIQECGNVQHEILLKLLFYTAVRVSELVHIEVGDVDLDACKIFINRGKGAKDRYILFPANFRLVLKSHLHAAPPHRYLFHTRPFPPLP